MRPTHRPKKERFLVRLLSPLGSYAANTLLCPSAAVAINPDICFSVIDCQEDEGFSEIDNLTPAELPILATMMLCVELPQLEARSIT